MRFQIIVVEYDQPHIYPPYGAMYIARTLMNQGHEVRIEVSNDWHNLAESELCTRIRDFQPDVVGFSATIFLAYAYVKKASQYIRQQFPALPIIVGGSLTSAAQVLLSHSDVDIAVIGEGEATIAELAECLQSGCAYDDVRGIAYKKNGKVIVTPKRPPIARLEKLGYPAFELVPMQRYLNNIHDVLRAFPSYRKWDARFYEPHRNTPMLRVPTARGCISKCSFCYRHMRGIRHFDLDYLFDYVEYLMKRFRTNQFSFGDECFSSSKQWSRKFIQRLRERNLDIMFQILGMRVDTVDRQILQDLNSLGCWMIEYGFESGSPKMLTVMDKGATVEDNINAAIWTREAGIYTSPAFVLGMPGENDETIKESVSFLKRINYDYFQFTYAMPVPGTPLYDYALLKGYIPDQDKYLESVCRITPNEFLNSKAFINFTDCRRSAMMQWPKMLESALRQNSDSRRAYYGLKFKNAYKYVKRDGLMRFAKGFVIRKIEALRLKTADMSRFGQPGDNAGPGTDMPPEGKPLYSIIEQLRSKNASDGSLPTH